MHSSALVFSQASLFRIIRRIRAYAFGREYDFQHRNRIRDTLERVYKYTVGIFRFPAQEGNTLLFVICRGT